jgi:hypothetical protein
MFTAAYAVPAATAAALLLLLLCCCTETKGLLGAISWMSLRRVYLNVFSPLMLVTAIYWYQVVKLVYASKEV